MRRLARAATAALSGGRFISLWSVLVTVPLSFTVMAATGTGAPAAVGVALAASWCCFAAGLVVLGVAERTLRGARSRAAALAGGLVLLSAARPGLQDLWLAMVGAQPQPPGDLPLRMLTNVVVWAVVFVAVAIMVDSWRSLREANVLLSAVVAELAVAQERAAAYSARARGAVAQAAGDLRAAVAQLAGGDAAAADVAERLRAHAHALGGLANASREPGPGPRRARGRVRVLLRVPPRGAVPALYIVCIGPYAVHAVSPAQIVLAVVIAVGGGCAADLIARSSAARHVAASVLFLACSAAVGIGLSAAAAWGGQAQGPLAAVPAFVYVALAVSLSLCAGALHGLRVEQRRLSGAVSAEQRASRSATAPDRAALRAAADLLHRDGQGLCVVFALEHPHPTVDDLVELATAVGVVVDRLSTVFDRAPHAVGASALDTLLTTWGRVIDVRSRIDDAVRPALDRDGSVAADVYEIVAEGLLNAVKHGRSRTALVTVRMLPTGGGTRLRVCVRTPDAAAAEVELRSASLVRALGARLRADDDGVLLEATLMVAPPAASRAVVTAEHAGSGPRAPS